MTTAAWDGESLAADKMAVGNFAYAVSKLVKVKWRGKPAIAVGAGDVRDFRPIISAIKKGKAIPEVYQDEPTFEVMVVTAKKDVFAFQGSNVPLKFGKIRYAIGSGAQFALGAMYAGKSASEAVEIACQLDANSGMGVDVGVPG